MESLRALRGQTGEKLLTVRSTATGRVALAATVMGVSVMGDSMIYAVLPSRLGDFGLTAGVGVGLILSANRWIRLASNAWAAWVYTRFGLRGPFLASVGLAMVTTAAYGLFQGFWPLFLARIGWGICFSVQLVTMYMVVLREEPSHRGRLMGLYNSLLRSGSLMAALIGGLLVDLIGVRGAFLAVASTMALSLPLVLLLSERRAQLGPISTLEDGDAGEPALDPGPSGRRIWTLLVSTSRMAPGQRNRLLAVNYARFTNTFAVSGLVVATLGFLLRERVGESTDVVGATVGVATLTGIVLGTSWAIEVGLSAYFGHLSDRVGRGRMLRICLPVIMAVILVAVIGHPLSLILGVPVLFAATTAGKVTLDASAGDLAPGAYRAQVMGRYATWTDLGAASGPLAGYALSGVLSLSWVYVGAALLVASGLAFYTLAFADRRDEQSERL